MTLDKDKILENISRPTKQKLGGIFCFEALASTNLWLLKKIKSQETNNLVCAADLQTAGIGRSGTQWMASHSQNILMSVAHRFNLPLSELSGLSLVVGIAVINVLEKFDVQNLSLKWPNDVYLNHSKLAGILIQTQKHLDSGFWAVAGIGVNIKLERELKNRITQPVAQLSEHGISVENREKMIAKFIEQIIISFETFSCQGLRFFQSRWDELDYFKDKFIVLSQQNKQITGKYLGINSSGALRIRLQDGEVKEYYAGEVSVRSIK